MVTVVERTPKTLGFGDMKARWAGVLFEDGRLEPGVLLPIPARLGLDAFDEHIGTGWGPPPDVPVKWAHLGGLTLRAWSDVVDYFREAASMFQARARATADVVDALVRLPGNMAPTPGGGDTTDVGEGC